MKLKKKTPRSRSKPWKHAGGGCWVADGSPGPCDDEYRHEKTGHRLTMRTTLERHFDMPQRVSSLAELSRLTGVSRVRETKADRPTRARAAKKDHARSRK